MSLGRIGLVWSLGVVLAAGATVLGVPAAHAQAPVVMKLSTPTLNDGQHEFLRRFKAELEKRSGGKIKADIYPASQLGPIPRQIEAVQLGAIQVFVCPPEFLDGVDTRFSVPSAVMYNAGMRPVSANTRSPLVIPSSRSTLAKRFVRCLRSL